jgi:hypothetical protein
MGKQIVAAAFALAAMGGFPTASSAPAAALAAASSSPAAAPTLSVRAPDTIAATGVYTVTVDYSVAEAAHIDVALINMGRGQSMHGAGSLPVGPGAGTVELDIEVENQPRVDDLHTWQVKMISEATGEVLQSWSPSVWVRATLIDTIERMHVPDVVTTTGTYSVEVYYQAQARSELRLVLVSTDGQVYGSAVTSVTAGGASHPFEITVENRPPAGTGYSWRATLLSAEQPPRPLAQLDQPEEIEELTDQIEFSRYLATAIDPFGSVTVTVAYEVGFDREVEAVLRCRASQTRHGGARRALPMGRGTIGISFSIEGRPQAGHDCVWEATLFAQDGQLLAQITAPVRIIEIGDSLELLRTPNRIVHHGTYTLRIAYEAREARRLEVSLVDRNGSAPGESQQLGSTQIDLALGRSRINVPVEIVRTPAIGADHEWRATLYGADAQVFAQDSAPVTVIEAGQPVARPLVIDAPLVTFDAPFTIYYDSPNHPNSSTVEIDTELPHLPPGHVGIRLERLLVYGSSVTEIELDAETGAMFFRHQTGPPSEGHLDELPGPGEDPSEYLEHLQLLLEELQKVAGGSVNEYFYYPESPELQPVIDFVRALIDRVRG